MTTKVRGNKLQESLSEGFYWVLFKNSWIIAEYVLTPFSDFSESGDWYICGREETYSSDDFIEIGNKVERIT